MTARRTALSRGAGRARAGRAEVAVAAAAGAGAPRVKPAGAPEGKLPDAGGLPAAAGVTGVGWAATCAKADPANDQAATTRISPLASCGPWGGR